MEAALAAVVADDGEEEANPVEKKAGGKTKGEKRKRDDPENDEVGDEEDEADDDEEDEEEDEVLSGEQAFDFLSTDFGMEDGEDEDEDGLSAKAMHHMALQHSEEADGALVQLLSLRRQSRKRGLMEAQRNQLLIRTRAIDILEILVHRAESSTILLPLFLPLLRYCRTTYFTVIVQYKLFPPTNLFLRQSIPPLNL